MRHIPFKFFRGGITDLLFHWVDKNHIMIGDGLDNDFKKGNTEFLYNLFDDHDIYLNHLEENKEYLFGVNGRLYKLTMKENIEERYPDEVDPCMEFHTLTKIELTN